MNFGGVEDEKRDFETWVLGLRVKDGVGFKNLMREREGQGEQEEIRPFVNMVFSRSGVAGMR